MQVHCECVLLPVISRDCNDVIVRRSLAAQISGLVINTCGWIKGAGFQCLKQIAGTFEGTLYTELFLLCQVGWNLQMP